MTVFKHSYADLRGSTGLDPDFIRRLMRGVPELKTTHTAKGERGELLVDEQASAILRQAAQMRAKKIPFKQITERVAGSLIDQPSPTEPKKPTVSDSIKSPTPSAPELELAKAWLAEMQQAHQQALKAQQVSIAHLTQQLLLVTEGKDPAEVQRERERQQTRLVQLERAQAEAQRLVQEHATQLAQEQAQVTQLKANLEKVRCEAANLIKDFQTQKLAARERAVQRMRLLDQLDQLSWVQGGRKRDLLPPIRELA